MCSVGYSSGCVFLFLGVVGSVLTCLLSPLVTWKFFRWVCWLLMLQAISDFSDCYIVGPESTGSFGESEFGEERLDFPPPATLPEFTDPRGRSGPIIHMPFRRWDIGVDWMEKLVVGQFLDRRHFHTRTMQSLVNELWHTNLPVRIVARRENTFVFRFYDQEDADHAMARGPWAIRGGLLVLDYWTMYGRMDSFRVRQYAVWVRLYNLPFEAYKSAAAEFLGEALGEVVAVDLEDVFPRHFRYLRIRVLVKLEATLMSGFYLSIPGDDTPRWIECRYERIYKFCRACGLVGHTYPQCGLPRAEARARVDEAINKLAAQFQTMVRTDDSVPYYSNGIRAFARSNSRRDTHMWAARQDLFSNQQ